MNDRRAHFLTMLGDACVSARVAGLRVELVLADGDRIAGTPSPGPSLDEATQIDETGYSSPLHIDDSAVSMEEVVEFAVVSP